MSTEAGRGRGGCLLEIDGRPEMGHGEGPTGDRPRRRVALVTPVFSPSVGGAELNLRVVALLLSKVAAVEVFTSKLNLTAGGPRVGGLASSPAFPFPVHYLPSVRLFGERLVLPLRLLGSLLRSSPDVVWTSNPSLTGDIAGLFALFRSKRWVVTYHGDVMKHKAYARPYTAFEHRHLRRASSVICQGPRYAARLVAAGMSARKVHAVVPGPGLGDGTPPEVPPTPEFERPGTDHPFLFVGGLDWARAYKRPELLLDAFAVASSRHSDMVLWIVGEGDRRFFLEERARHLGLSAEKVRFLGQLTDAQLALKYRDAWALVLPSTETEAFGIVTLEALNYGCPSILPDSTEAGEVLGGEGVALTYDDRHAAGLELALERMWTDSQLRARLSRRAPDVARHFSWSTAAPEIVNFILARNPDSLTVPLGGELPPSYPADSR
ncbi:MAG TPA: glycosyltransferase family 4 protein [Thermoplasmata archaeon]|nr:glycosyltransferase family 4 protein [Thermoplasmata archaeon]